MDLFKRYNDSFGHLAGDECLKQVAHALSGALRRQSDFVSRYGGEEFVVVLRGCEAAAGLRVAESLRMAVEDLGIPSPAPSGGYVTASVGLACTSLQPQKTPSALLGLADAALYRAKALGRNRVEASVEPEAARPRKSAATVTA